MIRQFHANQARLRRHQRIRRRLEGTPERPRLNVFRSGHHIYAQVIDDSTGRTLAAASSLDESLHDFTPAVTETPTTAQASTASEEAPAAEAVAAAAPAKGKSAKAEKAPKGGQPQKGGKGGPAAVSKIALPQAQKGSTRTPVEALAFIAN